MVCIISQPGLLPCLGHDLSEGVLSCDLALYLKNIIKKEKMVHILALKQV